MVVRRHMMPPVNMIAAFDLKAAAQACGYMTWVGYGKSWLIKTQALPKELLLSCGKN